MANFQVNLLFKADTTAATNNIQQLGQLLSNISTKTQIGIDNGSLSQAVSSAQQLSVHLQNAVNQNTGKLDLSKLNSSLKSAGTDLQTLTTQLQAAGPAGQQAFLKIATAVASAETPMLRINQRLKDFGVTLANTVKWQVASTAIHGISGMLSSAVGHAEDLNKALNDIRIVTGYSTDTMSKFTIEASAAARELNSTTTEYAKAALIFYQQGLSGNAVSERADVVVKLSQVTGQSAEQVSSQMTAIWNNFDDGTKSLEYYADALTKLGAATAASTDEISDGLEKFAAIAETVGLSYEYAAAAVATVIDKTRQSADVVGTAFKTIFARMQGLSLGDTLEDGVDLNKYSAALEKVGVDVLTADGELREMDQILDELGEKWQGFGQSTKVALAQTVAGVRQYNQMISLMDNWDSVKENIDLAKDATGELTTQQEIWSESYEAAANRVKQAQNELYEQFVNDKSIVVLNDTFASLIKTISSMIDSMGGVVPIVLMLAGLFSKTLFPMIQAGFKNLRDNIAVFTGAAAKDIAQMQSSMASQMQSYLNNTSMSEGLRQQVSLSAELLKAKQKLAEASKGMSHAEQIEAQQRMATAEAITAQVQETLARKKALEDEIKLLESKILIDNRRVVGQSSAIHQFRSQNSDMSQEEQDDIVESAMSTNLSSNVKELNQLVQRKQLTADMESAQARINQLQDQYNNGVFKNGQEKAKVYEKLEQEKAVLATLEGKGKALTEEEKNRLSYLEKVVQLQKNMSNKGAGMSADEVYKASVGTAKVEQDSPSAIHGPDTIRGQYGDSIRANAMKMAGASIEEDGSLQMEASFQGLEKLYSAMAKYGEITATTNAVLQDYANASQQVTASDEALTQAKKASAEASDSVTIAEEKYNQLVAKHGKNSAQARTQLTLLNKAKKEAAKADDEVTKAEQRVVNSQSAAQKVMLQSKNTVMEMAQSAGLSAEQLAQLEQEFKILEQGGPSAATAMDNIKTSLSTMAQASSETEGSLFELSNSLKEVMISSGISPEAFNTLITKLEQLKLLSPQAAAEIRNAVAAMKESSTIPDPGVKFDKLAVSVAGAAGKIGMIIGSMKSVANAFKEGNDPLQTMITLLTSASMILPALISLQNSLASSTIITNAVTAVSNALDAVRNKLLTAKTGATVGLTFAEWGLVAAEWALKVVTDPVGGAIVLGLIIAGTAAILSKTAATKGLTEAQIEQNQSTIESTEKTNELTQAWIDQMSTMDELIAKYEALRRAGGDYGEAAEDIINAVPDVIDAYSELAEGLDLNPEQLEKFNELIKEMRQGAAQGGEEGVAAIQQAQSEMDALLSPEASAVAKEGASAAMSQTAQAIVNVGDAKWENNQVTRHVGGAATQFKSFYDDDGKLLGANEEDAAGKLLEKHGVGTWDSIWGGYNIALDTSSTENFLKDYESLLAAQKEMESVLGDVVDDSDTYREISDMLKGSEEEYQKLAEMQAEAEKFGVIDAKVALEGQGKTLEGIDSYAAYNEYKTALANQMQADNPEMSAEEAEAAADAWLRAQGAVEEYVKAEDKIGFATSAAADEAERLALATGATEEQAQQAANNVADAKKKQLDALYNSLETEEERALFLEIDFNKYESDNAIRSEITRLQGLADEKELNAKITKIETAQSTLKESGMTAENWNTMRNETLNWGQDGIMEFNDFLNMSYEAQQQYLNDQMNAQQEALTQSKQATIDALKESLNNATSDEEKIAIQENIDLLEEELAIAERLAEEKAIEAEGIDYQEWQDYAKYLREVNDLTEDQIELSEEAALKEKKQIKAIKDLESNFSKYAKVIEKGNVQSEEYAEAIENIKDNIELLTDTDINSFTDDFITNPRTIQALDDIANGVDGAVEKFQSMAAVNAMVKLGFELDEDSLIELENKLTEIQEQDYDIPIGATLDDSAAIQGLASLLMESGATADQIQAAFNQIGWEPEIETRDYTVSEEDVSRGYISVPTGIDPLEITQVPLDSSVSSGMTVQLPYIKSATKTGVSGGGYQPQSNKSGGGGGGGSKPTLKSDQGKERYHTLQNQLEDLKSEYDDISQAADRAFGKDRLKLMDDQIKKTDEMIEKQEEYLAAISADLPKDKAIMEAYYSDLIDGPAIEFDENGNISNFDAIQDAMYATYNANAENMSAEDWEVFEEKYGKLEEYIAQYEETYDLLREEEKAYQDLINQRMDEQLAIIQYQVDLKVDVADDALEVLEFQLSRLEDDAFSAAEAIALMSDQTELLMDKVAANTQGIQDILNQQLSSSELERFVAGDASVLEGKEFTQDQVDALRNYRSELLSLNQDLLQVREDVQSKVMDTFDAWNEKLQKGIEKFDHYSSVLTSYKNIVDLVGKSYLGVDNELLKSMNDAMIENSINKVGATRAAYEALLESQANAQAQYEAAVASGNENDIKFWADTLETIGEEVDAAQENMMAAWEESLQLAAEEFQRQVDVALEEFNTALTGFASMEEFRENFDFAKEVEEEYVPAYEKIYELSKLNRDINKTLNDDRVIKGKEKLLELQEKINQYQQDGVEMSEYEIANLQREYELRMAEIALEEARNAKDTVRMSKDNEGNWSYVYTTNTEAVDTAQQDYEDALFAMQQANDEYLDEMSNLILDATQRMNEEIAALRLEDFANQEEYDAKVQEITEKYMGRIQYGQEQMQKALDNNAILYENDWTAYSEATGYKIATDQEYVDSFDETILGKLLNSESQVVNVYEMINDQIGGLLEATSGAYSSWSSQVDEANQAAGTSTENFADDMDNAINGPGGISESSEDAADSVYDMAEDMIEDFDRVAQAVSDWQHSYSDDIDAIIEKNLDAIEVCNALLSVLSDVQDVDLSNLIPTYDPYGKTYDNTTNSEDKDEEVVVVPVEQRGGDDDPVVGGGGGSNTGIDTRPWRKEASFTHFASGGYTGEWGDDGRLAVLHQKELVLNAEDTTNMFKALNLTRQILDTIDLNAQYASGGLGQVMASSIRDAITQTLEQHVTIEADFPSVTDHNEIEIAMKNLINTASQFAHRK